MTAREYLEARGWNVATSCLNGDEYWYMLDAQESHSLDSALRVQRARDAAEARAAWVAFAAAAQNTRWLMHDEEPMENAELIGVFADAMLDAYRARFAVEVTP